MGPRCDPFCAEGWLSRASVMFPAVLPCIGFGDPVGGASRMAAERDFDWPPREKWRFKVSLLQALTELRARGEITNATFLYGTRVVDRSSAKDSFFESLETSARACGISRKSAQRARRRLMELGILICLDHRHGPTKPRRYRADVPLEYVEALAERMQCAKGDRARSPDSQDAMTSPDRRESADSRLSARSLGTLEAPTRDNSDQNRRRLDVPQTSEPSNCLTPRESRKAQRHASARPPDGRGARQAGLSPRVDAEDVLSERIRRAREDDLRLGASISPGEFSRSG